MKMSEEPIKIHHSKFQRHTYALVWKSYLQRQRRWRILLAETIFASLLFMVAVYIAEPVFLTPLEDEPEPPLTTTDLLASLGEKQVVGFTPDTQPYMAIMDLVALSLNISVMRAETEYDLNNNLYKETKDTPRPIEKPVLWIIWKPMEGNMWKFSIRSTERARYASSTEFTSHPNPHLRAGFLALQLAISQAIVQYSSADPLNYEFKLLSMPVSPLMQKERVHKALSGILLCFTLALIPPVLETQALVVSETKNKFKRSLRMRGVEYSSMYFGWLVFAYLTALPICFLAAITLLLIFRWIHLLFGLLVLLAYVTVMIMTALIMAMFHSQTWTACLWSTLFTLLQTYLSELIVHHEYDKLHIVLTGLLQVLLPPLGLVHVLNQFALLQTGSSDDESLPYTLGTWSMLILLYFSLLMLLQRTIGQQRAIGGQVSWKSIIFKQIENVNELRTIENPTGREREKLQEVDELVAKAVSFVNVSKSIMGTKVLDKITLDIYRGEFTTVFAERVQGRIILTVEDLLTGLTFADSGEINVLGQRLRPDTNLMTVPHMMGYCHNSNFLIQDLTVDEHFMLFNDICMWSESRETISQYQQIHEQSLLSQCRLGKVRHEPVRRLDEYYRAQLCWALALLMEPKIVIIPYLMDQDPRYIMVIKDKIMQYKKYITLIEMSYSSLQLEYADRVFVFDRKILAFGGTPAYMFFKFGREYRLRLTIRSESRDDESTKQLLQRAGAARAAVRAHLGSLLILRLPASPTATVSAFVQDLVGSASIYGMTSMNISIPDFEEVYRRAMMESRAAFYETSPTAHASSKAALKRFTESRERERKLIVNSSLHMRTIGWKYFTFFVHYRLYFIITLISALLAGLYIGISLTNMLKQSYQFHGTKKLLHGEILTMEFLGQDVNLILRADNSTQSTSVANAYVLSEPGATQEQIKHLTYSALPHTESLTEYLVTCAIDSPQLYVRMFAYGMDVKTDDNGTLLVQALYSPLHRDQGAAARSLGKVYTALLRHYSGNLDASIQVTDDPLALDLTPWMRDAARAPLFLQFLLILTISHITLMPSMENGLIRHVQSHAMNFSPARYWFSLYFCDLVLYWILVAVITGVMVLIMFLSSPAAHFMYGDLLVIPFMLVLYGFACVPQAYLFSLGPRVALNAMTFVIVNIVFAETTILAKIFYGDILNLALWLMRMSPQFNMAYAFVKIKQIFLYNSECIIFKSQNLCTNKILHKCCKKCGLLQNCFSRQTYLSYTHGIIREAVAMASTAAFYVATLLLLEYKVPQRVWMYLVTKWARQEVAQDGAEPLNLGAEREKEEVLTKWKQIQTGRRETFNTYGEYLLAQNLAYKELGAYKVRGVYLGLGKGEVLALSGLKKHGRLELIEMLAGLRQPSQGLTCCMSKWNHHTHPHLYARQISVSCGQESLPPWMTVYDALELVALLRGVPPAHVKEELRNIIDALHMTKQADVLICRITEKIHRTRVHFAAAVVGAPSVLVLDECTAHQKFSVRRSMYSMLHALRRQGHAIFISSSSLETHMPMTNRLAILFNGSIYDVDNIDNLVARYSNKGYTVVVHLKDEVDIRAMFEKHFNNFVINDTSEVLVNVQILDYDMNWATIFRRMEELKVTNQQVYAYIITAIPIDYIYNSIISNEKGNWIASDVPRSWFRKHFMHQTKLHPSNEMLESLIPFERKYDIMKLKELPWSVIFQT